MSYTLHYLQWPLSTEQRCLWEIDFDISNEYPKQGLNGALYRSQMRVSVQLACTESSHDPARRMPRVLLSAPLKKMYV